MPRPPFVWMMLIGVVMFGGTGSVAAQTASPDAASSRALARAQALLKQVNAQKIAAEAELAKLRVEFAAEQAALASAKTTIKKQAASLKGTEARLTTTTRLKTQTERRLGSMKTRLAQTTTALMETRDKLRETEASRQRLEAQLAATAAELADAERKNQELYEVNIELLQEFAGETTLQRLFRSEPVTGIRGVQLENLTQEYAHRLDDNRRAAPSVTAPAP